MKKVFIALSAALLLTAAIPVFAQMSGTVPYLNQTPVKTEESTEIPNPLVKYETLEKLREAAGFDFALPALPEGFTPASYILIGGETADVIYRKDDAQIRVRASVKQSDISGDYNTYAFVKTHQAEDVDVTASGNQPDAVNLATFRLGEVNYAISFGDAMDMGAVDAMILGMRG